MSEHYPRIRVRSSYDALLIREALNFTFYMRHSHAEVTQRVLRSLEIYLRVIGSDALSQYSEEAGAWLKLDAARWETIYQEFRDPDHAGVHLVDEASRERKYRFDYHGRRIGHPARWPGMVSSVSFWLPTEYLEEHGPGRVRELAMELAAPLPFCSGHAGLAFSSNSSLVDSEPPVSKLIFRYPGMDIPDLDSHTLEIGTRVRASSWLTFLGQPVLGELGGVAGLRSRLKEPTTTVQELEADRAVVTLGPWPEAGDTEAGHVLPAYRELARVLEPWLYFKEPLGGIEEFREATRRWQRRFLD